MKKSDAKMLAKNVLEYFLCNAEYWGEVDLLSDGLTDEEYEEVNKEFNKIVDRLYKQYDLYNAFVKSDLFLKERKEVKYVKNVL